MKFLKSARIKHHRILALPALILCLVFLSGVDINDDGKTEMVVISTEFGDMIIQLYEETPQHRENFLKLTRESYYDSLLFHRVIKNFMIQGGDPDSRGAAPGTRLGTGGPGYTIPAEFNPKFIHKKGALAAARQGDQVNPEKESSGSQFYIVDGQPVTPAQLDQVEQRLNSRPGAEEFKYTDEQREIYTTVGGTPHLDGEYTVFGEVVDGFHVIDSIAAQPTDRMNRPLEDIPMTIKIERVKWE